MTDQSIMLVNADLCRIKILKFLQSKDQLIDIGINDRSLFA